MTEIIDTKDELINHHLSLGWSYNDDAGRMLFRAPDGNAFKLFNDRGVLLTELERHQYAVAI